MAASSLKPRRIRPGTIPALLAPILCLTLLSLYTTNPNPFTRAGPPSPGGDERRADARFPRISAAHVRHVAGVKPRKGESEVREVVRPGESRGRSEQRARENRRRVDMKFEGTGDEVNAKREMPAEKEAQPEPETRRVENERGSGHEKLGAGEKGESNDESNDESNNESSDEAEEPLLTLVLTTYNVDPVLNETLQTLNLSNRIVLLTVDDASTDGTLSTLRKLPKNTIIPLSANTPGGVGTPSNLAIESVTTKYVAFLDGDDLLTASTLHNMLALAEKTSAQVVYADFTRFRDTPKGRVMLPSYDGERWPREHVLNRSQNEAVSFALHQSFGMSPVPWRKLYNVDFLREYGIRFPEGDFVFEDNSFHWLVTTYGTRLVYLNESVVAHRIGREGQSTSAFEKPRDIGDEDESMIKAKKAGVGMADYVANQNYIGFRLLECDNGVWRCNSARLKFLTWVTGSDWICNIVQRAGDDKITAKFRSVKARSSDFWRRYMGGRFPDIPDGSWRRKPLRVKPAPELSIVVPVFNDMAFIDDFLANIAFLEVSHEVIFVDNNSTDGSLSHLERITKRSDHLYVLHTAKSGAGRARNLGTLFAEGDHIMFLDCDDRFDTSAIDEVVMHAQESLAEVTFVKYELEYTLKNDTGLTVRKRTGMFNSDIKLFDAGLAASSLTERRNVAGRITNYPWNKLVRRDLLIRENIFFGSTLVNNDVLFHWHAVLTARSLEFYDVGVTFHRKFEGGDRITDMKGSERLELADALAMTNRVLVKAGIAGLSESWGSFVKGLLSWGRERVGEEWKAEYDRRAEIVKDVVARGGVELVMRE